MIDKLIPEIEKRMGHALENFSKELAGLRTGRASVGLLEPVRVDVYGSMMALNQVATINCPEPRMLTVNVWDRSLVKSVEKAIVDANLGLNPAAEGQTIRVPIPSLTEERRQELTKVAAKYAEESKIVVRNVRRDGMDALKKLEKEKVISEDDHERHAVKVQKVTDEFTKKIDDLLSQKQKEILKV